MKDKDNHYKGWSLLDDETKEKFKKYIDEVL